MNSSGALVAPARHAEDIRAHAGPLGSLVACVGGVVTLTEALLWRVTVLKLVATANEERRYLEQATADVDVAAAELADAERARTELVRRLAVEWGATPAELNLTAIIERAPEGVALALAAHRRRLHGLTAELEMMATQVRRHIGVSLRHLDEMLAEARGAASTYNADGRTEAAPSRPRVHRAL
jgi:hypothetical protein